MAAVGDESVKSYTVYDLRRIPKKVAPGSFLPFTVGVFEMRQPLHVEIRHIIVREKNAPVRLKDFPFLQRRNPSGDNGKSVVFCASVIAIGREHHKQVTV